MTKTTLPLSGLKVLDLSRVLAGPFCAMVLADLGAEVVKIERPDGGDETRAWGPPFVHDGNSAYFLAANRNKRCLFLDFRDAADRKVLDGLISKADVLIHNFTPEILGRLNLTEAVVRKLNPKVVIAGITGFGEGNSFSNQPGYDFLVQAMSGLMSVTGEPNGEPMKLGVAVTDVIAGLYAVIGILSNLIGRDRKYTMANNVDVSLMQAAVSALVNVGQATLVGRNAPRRYGNGHPQIVPYQLFQSQDSHIAIAIGNDAQFQRFCETIDCIDLVDDDRFATNPQRVSNREALLKIISDKIRQNTTAHWVKLLAARDLPAGPVQRVDEIFDSQWAKERKIIAHDEMGIPHIQSPLAKSFGMSDRVHKAPAMNDELKPVKW